MSDLEKIIKEFEKICEYTLRPHEFRVLNDVLVLLKEQEPVKPNGTKKAMSFAFNGMLTGYCPRCKTIVNSIGNSGACGKCGQKLDWE